MKCRECLVWNNKYKDWQLSLANYSYLAPLSGLLLRSYKDVQRSFEEHRQLSDFNCEKESRCILLSPGLSEDMDKVSGNVNF